AMAAGRHFQRIRSRSRWAAIAIASNITWRPIEDQSRIWTDGTANTIDISDACGGPSRDHYTSGGYDGPMPGYTKDKQTIETRLRRIEGQVRGIQKMVAEDRYCIDVLTQVNATRAALESVALQLFADRTEHCVTEAIRSG